MNRREKWKSMSLYLPNFSTKTQAAVTRGGLRT